MLAAQIEQGLPADVFASANTGLPWQLYRKQLVTKPVDFTSNKLVIVVARGNPLHIRSVYDLEGKGVKIVMAAAGVPVGDYTRKVLGRLGLSDLVDKAVSQETDVREVLSKVVLGEADAGFVYSTDAKTVAGQGRAPSGIPQAAQPRVLYAAAAVKSSKHLQAAKAWVQASPHQAGAEEAARGGLPAGSALTRRALAERRCVRGRRGRARLPALPDRGDLRRVSRREGSSRSSRARS